MLYAKKANRQVTIKKDEKDVFLAQGFTICEDTDGKGKGFKVIATPDGDLKAQIVKLKAENTKLKKQLEQKK